MWNILQRLYLHDQKGEKDAEYYRKIEKSVDQWDLWEVHADYQQSVLTKKQSEAYL